MTTTSSKTQFFGEKVNRKIKAIKTRESTSGVVLYESDDCVSVMIKPSESAKENED